MTRFCTRSGALAPHEADAALTMTDARDATSVLGAVDACGSASVQARVLARPLAPFRKDMVQRLGKTLMQRFSRGSQCPRPHAVLAWAMAPRIPAVAVAVVGARPDPKAALAVLSAMHPQARAVCLASTLLPGRPAAPERRCSRKSGRLAVLSAMRPQARAACLASPPLPGKASCAGAALQLASSGHEKNPVHRGQRKNPSPDPPSSSPSRPGELPAAAASRQGGPGLRHDGGRPEGDDARGHPALRLRRRDRRGPLAAAICVDDPDARVAAFPPACSWRALAQAQARQCVLANMHARYSLRPLIVL